MVDAQLVLICLQLDHLFIHLSIVDFGLFPAMIRTSTVGTTSAALVIAITSPATWSTASLKFRSSTTTPVWSVVIRAAIGALLVDRVACLLALGFRFYIAAWSIGSLDGLFEGKSTLALAVVLIATSPIGASASSAGIVRAVASVVASTTTSLTIFSIVTVVVATRTSLTGSGPARRLTFLILCCCTSFGLRLHLTFFFN